MCVGVYACVVNDVRVLTWNNMNNVKVAISACFHEYIHYKFVINQFAQLDCHIRRRMLPKYVNGHCIVNEW